MIYLSGAVRAEVLAHPRLGVMLTPMMGNAPDLSDTAWAADNGCFSQPEEYTDAGYLSWLDSKRRFWPTCLFATAPDVWGDGPATLAKSLPVLPAIRERVPAALVYQRGLEHEQVPWEEFDCLFLGGPDHIRFTEPVHALIGEAKARGKTLHLGRVNSARRLTAAMLAGFDSADGTFLAFGPDVNLPRLQRWLDRLERSLEGVEFRLWNALHPSIPHVGIGVQPLLLDETVNLLPREIQILRSLRDGQHLPAFLHHPMIPDSPPALLSIAVACGTSERYNVGREVAA